MAKSAIANLAIPLAAFATAPILARQLGVQGRGELAAVTAPFLLVTIIAMLGLPDAVTYLVSRRDISHRAGVWTAGIMLTASGIVSTVILIALAPWLSGGDPRLQQLMVVAALAVTPTIILGALRGGAGGIQAWNRVNLEKYATALLRIIAIFAAALLGVLSVESASLITVLAPILGFAAYFGLTSTNAGRLAAGRPGEMLRYGSRVWIGSMSGIILNKLDQVLMVPLAGALQLGLYAAASAVADAALLANNAVRDVAFSTETREATGDRLTAAARRSFLVSILVAGTICATAWLWFPWLFGQDFAAGVGPVVILAIASALGVPGSIAGAGLSARGRPGIRSMALVIAAAINFVLLLILVPHTGAYGAAWATLVGNVIASNINIIASRRLFGMQIRDFYLVRLSDVRSLAKVISRLVPTRRLRVMSLEKSHKSLKPTVLMWKSVWLPPTETFISSQIASLDRWSAVTMGAQRVESALLTGDERILFGSSRVERIRRRVFELTGRSRRVERAIRESGGQVIHAHFAHEGFFVRRAAIRLRLPLIVSLYGSDVTSLPARPGLKGWRTRMKLRKTFETADLVLAISESIAAKAIEYGAPPTKVTVHHIGMPAADSGSVGVATDQSGVLFVGRMVPKKGLDHLISAIDSLPGDLRSVNVTVIGDGPLRPQLEHRAKELGLRFSFLGYRDQDEVLAAMGSHDVLCVPSVVGTDGDSEGLPTVIVQAGASALPVVAYKHGGIPEIITDGVNGLLIAEGDHEQLGAALQRILSDRTLQQSMALAALRVATTHFSADLQGRRLAELYDAVIRGRSD
jgi:glycosyltransferase involved in cell wall biosynthesis/O-antigen/teichoic acid export membrane protein